MKAEIVEASPESLGRRPATRIDKQSRLGSKFCSFMLSVAQGIPHEHKPPFTLEAFFISKAFHSYFDIKVYIRFCFKPRATFHRLYVEIENQPISLRRCLGLGAARGSENGGSSAKNRHRPLFCVLHDFPLHYFFPRYYTNFSFNIGHICYSFHAPWRHESFASRRFRRAPVA